MKNIHRFPIFALLLACFALTGCHRRPHDVWEDSKSSKRHFSRGFRTLGGKGGTSRQITNRNEFMPPPEECYEWGPGGYVSEAQFIPLSSEGGANDAAKRQPIDIPGDPGSSLPSIDAFQDPTTNPRYASIFDNIWFEYNSNLVKGQHNYDTLKRIANFMVANPNTYVFIEGHCCERGPEAYNLALGSRRANAVRDYLIQQGVNQNHLFTISYGKERPLVMGSDEEALAQNRRAEFKIYQR